MRTGGRMYRNTGRETFTLPVNCEQAAALDGRKDFSFGCFVLFCLVWFVITEHQTMFHTAALYYCTFILMNSF